MSNERKNYTQNFPLLNKDVKTIDFAETADALQIERNNRLAGIMIYSSTHRIRKLDYTQWKVGTSGTQFSFIANGTDAENTIVNGVGPYGATIPLWKCYNSDAASDADGGWNADVPHLGCQTAYYRYSVWIKCEGDQNGTTYFGCRGENIQTLAGTTDTNPYFWYGDLPAMGQWYLLVGHIHTYGSSYVKHADSGIYNTSGTKVAETLNDFRFINTTVRCHTHRCYLYYTTSAATIQYMAYPRIDILSGTVNQDYPSLASLISGAWVSYEDTKEKNFLVSGSDMSNLRSFATGIVRYGSNSYPSWIDPNLTTAINIRACHLEQVRQVIDDARNNARCVDCLTSCSIACSIACYSSCGSWSCSNSCSGGCITSCSASCGASGNCSGICTGGCSNTVYFWCSGCGTGCSGHGCAAGCSSGCRGCSGSCYASCSNDCNTTCSVTCGNASCNNTCSKSCYNSCDVSCYSLCSGSNRMGTDAGAL